ncbi:MAG: hypothetical protein VW625_04685, partial [Perlucidibaca sp.]
MTIILRAMTRADLFAVHAIEQVSHPTPWPMKGLQESLDSHQAFVLEDEGRVAAFAFVQRILDEAH